MTNWAVSLVYVRGWLLRLDQSSYEQVVAAIELLEEYGPALGRPLVDAVKGSRFKNMKELRPGSTGKSELRVLFAFDPERRAVLLIGGDKWGAWNDWYRVNVPRADRIMAEHIEKLKEGLL